MGNGRQGVVQWVFPCPSNRPQPLAIGRPSSQRRLESTALAIGQSDYLHASNRIVMFIRDPQRAMDTFQSC